MTRPHGLHAAIPGRRFGSSQPSSFPRRFATSSPWKRGRTPRLARGFTLLEVLIALVLSSVLLAGLWALFSTYEALFSGGQAKVENAQLIRALFEQIARDLRSAIPDSSAGVPGQSASVRRFGLFGTESALQVDVLQMSDAHWALESTGQDEPTESDRPQNVPELHTVQYLFQEAGEGESPESGVREGLVRRELGWEIPAGDRRNSGGLGRTSGRSRSNHGSTSATGSGDPMNLSGAEFDPEDDSLLEVPEVVKLGFRYYDGSGWTTQWNSLTQKSLPVAVEVVLSLKRPQDSWRRRPSVATSVESASEGDASEEGALEEDASEEDVLQEFLTGSSEQADVPEYRLLVFLPAASRPETSSRVPRDLPAGFALPPPALPPPQPAPPRGPSPRSGLRPGSLRAVLPDQWMRAGS